MHLNDATTSKEFWQTTIYESTGMYVNIQYLLEIIVSPYFSGQKRREKEREVKEELETRHV